ncbi:MAG: SdrD B-like domain-containing protein [Arcicella sp.]|nr:SdrD B-like domain-containing protein [Arcicella sp.]
MIKSLRLRMVKVLIPCFSLLLLASLFSEINAQSVTGKVFRDFDASGQQTTASASPVLVEPGVPGVTVKAFNAAGTQIGASVQTALDGTYTLPVATSNQVRIEFSNFPAAFFSGPKGALSGTSVQFVNGGSTANLGINYPSDYCGTANPQLVTPCYINGTPLNGGNSANENAIVSVPYTPTGNGTNVGVGNTSENKYLAKGVEVGATWGMAYQRSSKFIFTSALLKRHSGLGAGGPGAIYKIDNSGSTPITTLFVDLNADLGVSAGINPRNLTAADSIPKFKTQPSRDSTAFGLVGKMALGDLDISDDEKSLWVINTFDRKLYELPIGSPAVKPTTKIAHTLPNPGCINGVFRPWAVKFWRGKVYVGGVCTAENAGGTAADLKAYIYSFTPGDANADNFTEVYNFKLDYPRGFTSVDGFNNKKTSAAWKPWIAKWSDITNPLPGEATYNQTIYPQPMLSDIEFDVDGSMILGFMDRVGHQLGSNNYSTLATDFVAGSTTVRKLYEGTSAGDLLRAGLNADGVTYTLEKDATVNGVISGGKGQSPSQGPGTGEFYWQDMYVKNADKNRPNGTTAPGTTNPDGGHQEISLGGLALFPGKNEVVETVFDPLNAFRAGGVRWFDNTTGQAPRAYEIFGQDAGGLGVTFGKANGLGDLEILCSTQPIEVGNRLWNDTNKNGVQDPGEPALSNVTVQLFKNGVKIGSDVVTTATGEFYFTGLVANATDYEIRIPNIKGASKQSPLAGLDLTTANVSSNGKDLIDSDAGVTGTNTYASIPFTTGNAGENLHALDAGFSCVPPVATPSGVTGDVKICDPISTFTLPAAKTGADAETWTVITSAANPAATINQAGVVSGMITNGKYTFVLTNNNTGCTDTVSIVRSALAMAGADKSLCFPASTSTVNAAMGSQVWSVISQPQGATAAVAANGNVTGMTRVGVYTFRITDGSCFEETQITIKAKPDAGLDLTICSPQTTATLFVPTGADTWSVVTNPVNPSPAIIGVNSGSISGMVNTGTYQFVLNSVGCTDTVSVVKKAGITITVTDTISTCIGGNFTITTTSDAGAGATYSWKGPNGFTSSQQNVSLANLVSASMGIYTLNVTSTTGCSATATTNIMLSDISVSLIAGKLNYCVGEIIVLRTFNPEVGYTYDWTGPNGFSSMNKLNISVPTDPTKVQAGLYTMLITSPNGCKAATTINITVTECLSIGNLVWDDVNNDGLNNNGEIGMGGVPVRLFKAKLDGGGFPTDVPDGAAIQTTTTSTVNATLGKYLFSGLIPGSYIVEIDAPTGYKSSTGTNGSLTGTYEPSLNANSDVNDNDDGTKKTGQTITSKAIELGNFTEPTGDGDTAPTSSDADKNSNLTIDFGIYNSSSIGDFVWSDTDKDGVQDAGELGVLGITVRLFAGNSTTALATTTTDANGKYLFDNLTPGTYTVEFVKTSIGAGNSFSPQSGAGSTPANDSNADLVTGKSAPITVLAGNFYQTIDAGIIGDCPASTVGTLTVPSLCVGQSLTMNATSSDPLAKYAWSSSNSFTATTASVTIPNLTTSNTGVYTVTITNSNLCTSALTANVVVNPLPTITVAPITICAGATGNLTASGATTYAWTGPGTFTATGVTPTVSAAGVYTVTGTNNNGCIGIATTQVTVSPSPTITATGVMVCEEKTATLSATGATTYSWVGPNNFTANTASISIPNATSINAGVYTVTGVTNGCTAIGLASLMVDKNPIPTATGAAICLGGSGTISVLPAGLTYAWSSNNFTSTQQMPSINSAGTYTVVVTDSKGCSATAIAAVTVGNVLGITATSNSPVCAGTRLELSANGGTGSTYLWTSPSGVTSTSATPFTNNATSADNGTWTVAVTNADGCKGTGSTNVVVNSALTGVTATASAPACVGSNITLNAKPDGSTYAWTGTGFSSTLQNPTITSPLPGTYNFTVVVTNANGCTATATTSSIINALPTATASSVSPVCFGSTIQLTGNTDGTKYDWSGPNNFNSTLKSPSIANATTSNSGTYTFIATNANGCTATATASVTVSAKINAGQDLSICMPISTAQLTLVAGATYTPEPTNPSAAVINNNVAIASGMTNEGTYIFYLVSTTGCRDTVRVFVNSKLDAGQDKVICSPKTAISLFALNGGQTWRYFANGSTLPAPTVTANNVTNITQNGNYLFILEQAGNTLCADTMMVTRKESPNAGADQVGASGAICESQTTAQLTAAGAGQTWSVAANSLGFGTAEINQAGRASKLLRIGRYFFVLTQGECTDTVVVERQARSSAGVDVAICEPETSVTLNTAQTGETWSAMATNPSASIFGANGKVSGLTGIGMYEFVLTSANGCTDTTKVTRFARPNAEVDLTGSKGICEPVTTAKLVAASAGTTWSVSTATASRPNGTNPVIDPATGAITGLTANGTYEFVLQNTTTLCSDTVKVERSAKPNAGVDVAICSDATTYKLPAAINNMTWSSVSTNPSGVQIDPITGAVTGMTAASDYNFVLTNVAGCTDTIKVTRKAIPTFDLTAIQATCTTGEANADAKLSISNLDILNKFDYTEGTTYTGTKTFATATVITNTTTTVTLPNPTADKSYTVRVFNANGCYTDKTVILKIRVCECKPDVCIPYSYKKTK